MRRIWTRHAERWMLRETRVGTELGRRGGEVLRLQGGRRLLLLLLVWPRQRVSGIGSVGQLKRPQRI